MIHDLDESLQVLLEQELPTTLQNVSISFATPDDAFPPSGVSLPAIDLFLYNIKESREVHMQEWLVERNSNGIATKKRSPVRVECSYLITAWPSDSPTKPRDEHAMLSEAMKVLLRHPIIPEEVLQGDLKGQDLPITTFSLQPDGAEMIGQFWQALGGKLKAAFKYTVIINVDAFKALEIGVVKKETIEV